jgi:8-oxo-dGTP diphosphatase
MEKFHLTVKGIVRRNGRILVIKRSPFDDHKPNVWETAGGGVECEGTPQEELAREIKEETGLRVRVGRPFNVFTFRKDTGEFKVGITFLCDYVSGRVKLGPEHVDYKWVYPRQFAKLKSTPSLHREIAEYARQK